MDNKILEATIEVFRECKVKSFPIDCFELLKHYGYRIYTYHELKCKNTELYEMCVGYSDDAFRDGFTKIVAYNEEKPIGRIRFSLMHELGHHVLNHTGNSKTNEKDANTFASYILAPRMAIHYAKCKNANDVAHLFNLSHEASENAFDDYRRWHRHVIIYKMSQSDKAMYNQFYDENKKCFIWSIKKCDFCGTKLYNSPENHCKICTLPSLRESSCTDDILWEDNMRRFHAAHLKWLYDH